MIGNINIAVFDYPEKHLGPFRFVDDKMGIIHPTDENGRLTRGSENVAHFVRQFFIGAEDGYLSAERSGRSAIPAK